jgi:hypothetical protein
VTHGWARETALTRGFLRMIGGPPGTALTGQAGLRSLLVHRLDGVAGTARMDLTVDSQPGKFG